MKIKSEAVNRREIYRYLGYKGQEPEEQVRGLVEEVLEELLHMIRPVSAYQYYRCEVKADKISLYEREKDIECDPLLTLTSKALADNLAQCSEVVLLAATLGIEADKLIQRYTVMNMAKASVAQACGAACIEAYCNMVQEEIGQDALERGLYLRPRFSPGYGDLALEYQQDFFGLLECHKRLGMSLTDSMLMLPTKSVTAIIGLTKNAQSCHIARCSSCNKTDCEFRSID